MPVKNKSRQSYSWFEGEITGLTNKEVNIIQKAIQAGTGSDDILTKLEVDEYYKIKDLSNDITFDEALNSGTISKEGYALIANIDNNIFKINKNGKVILCFKEAISPSYQLYSLYYENQKYYVVKFTINNNLTVDISGINLVDENALNTTLHEFGNNFKTINGQPIMGVGDIEIKVDSKQIMIEPFFTIDADFKYAARNDIAYDEKEITYLFTEEEKIRILEYLNLKNINFIDNQISSLPIPFSIKNTTASTPKDIDECKASFTPMFVMDTTELYGITSITMPVYNNIDRSVNFKTFRFMSILAGNNNVETNNLGIILIFDISENPFAQVLGLEVFNKTKAATAFIDVPKEFFDFGQQQIELTENQCRQIISAIDSGQTISLRYKDEKIIYYYHLLDYTFDKSFNQIIVLSTCVDLLNIYASSPLILSISISAYDNQFSGTIAKSSYSYSINDAKVYDNEGYQSIGWPNADGEHLQHEVWQSWSKINGESIIGTKPITTSAIITINNTSVGTLSDVDYNKILNAAKTSGTIIIKVLIEENKYIWTTFNTVLNENSESSYIRCSVNPIVNDDIISIAEIVISKDKSYRRIDAQQVGFNNISFDYTDSNNIQKFTYREDGMTMSLSNIYARKVNGQDIFTTDMSAQEITIPAGPQGPKGDKGDTGPAGKDGLNIPAKQISIFGDKSILVPESVQDTNYDIYCHAIHIVGSPTISDFDIYFEFYSSKNLECNSLQDLKTHLGNTFVRSCSGIAKSKQAYAITELNVMCNNGSIELLSGITITDTVRTI